MTTLLLSVCNIQNDGTSHLNIDLHTGKITTLFSLPKPISATGMCNYKGVIYSVLKLKYKDSYSLLLINNYNSHDSYKHLSLRNVVDAHSIYRTDVGLYVASTGNNSVCFYEANKDGNIEESPTIYKLYDYVTDKFHVNSIVFHNGSMLYSAFGEKQNNSWPDSCNGFIKTVFGDVVIKSGINHPHSLKSYNSKLYYLESNTSSLCEINDGVLFKLDGYVRGLEFIDNDTVAIAVSKGRSVSRSTGNPVPVIKHIYPSLNIVSLKDNKILNTFDLRLFCSEIYDIVVR